jgi:hypothetical protein
MAMDMGISSGPREVFPAWRRAQLEVDLLARGPQVAPSVLRTTGFLGPELAERVADWFLEGLAAPAEAVRASYRALERDTARLFAIAGRPRSSGGLGVRVRYTHEVGEPYSDADALCAELRAHRTMTLATIAREDPHPLLGSEEGGVVDRLRAVHDVFGHAALGVGFDLQAEYATWLQCRALFSPQARGAAFCELVGAVTAYVISGEKPVLRADLPPAELLAATATPRAIAGRTAPARSASG